MIISTHEILTMSIVPTKYLIVFKNVSFNDNSFFSKSHISQYFVCKSKLSKFPDLDYVGKNNIVLFLMKIIHIK